MILNRLFKCKAVTTFALLFQEVPLYFHCSKRRLGYISTHLFIAHFVELGIKVFVPGSLMTVLQEIFS